MPRAGRRKRLPGRFRRGARSRPVPAPRGRGSARSRPQIASSSAGGSEPPARSIAAYRLAEARPGRRGAARPGRSCTGTRTSTGSCRSGRRRGAATRSSRPVPSPTRSTARRGRATARPAGRRSATRRRPAAPAASCSNRHSAAVSNTRSNMLSMKPRSSGPRSLGRRDRDGALDRRDLGGRGRDLDHRHAQAALDGQPWVGGLRELEVHGVAELVRERERVARLRLGRSAGSATGSPAAAARSRRRADLPTRGSASIRPPADSSPRERARLVAEGGEHVVRDRHGLAPGDLARRADRAPSGRPPSPPSMPSAAALRSY